MTKRVALQLHPESRCDALTGIEVDVARLGARRLLLRYFLTGNLRHVRFPPQAWPADRTDGLWQHTCFEMFLRADGDDSYFEFNLSPSTHWAAYRFDGYRDGMTVAKEVGQPGPDPTAGPPSATLGATLELDRLASLSTHSAWHLGIAAVVEERSGRLSYWALAHPPGAPDFHHADCFALELPAVENP